MGGWPTRQTRSQNDVIATVLKNSGYTVTQGAGRGPEEAIKSPDGTMKGGAYVDITATKDGKSIRIQTVDTLADGKTPTPREQANAAKIRAAHPDDTLILIPKRPNPKRPEQQAPQSTATT